MIATLHDAHAIPPEVAIRHAQASAFIRTFAGGPEATSRLVSNVRTKLHALHLALPRGQGQSVSLPQNDWLLPVTVNSHAGRDMPCPSDPNGYVVSPITTYVHYGYDEARLLTSPWVRGACRALLGGIHGALAVAKADNVVILNNWLLSTNIHPPGWLEADCDDALRATLAAVTARWPKHAILIRSLNYPCNHNLLQALGDTGFILCPSRQVYLFDARPDAAASFTRTRNYLWDKRLLDKAIAPESGEYGAETLRANSEASIFERVAYLYGKLYLDKYSRLNPQYQPAWFRRGIEGGWLDVTLLRRRLDGRVDAAVGWFGREDLFTTPVVGYETALPQQLGLYRMLMAITLARAAASQAVLNLSSGAAGFKRLRGGVPAIEYTAVYARHLPIHRRAVWQTLAAMLQHVAVPLLKRHEL
ncbi:hypothetical protein DB346_17225 [Verrucomicrobia bacterium LW23]|nr:hypothetical protein DB346_17225 [Verrucomicrobia bacterium LW23]